MGSGRHGLWEMNIREDLQVVRVPIPHGMMTNARNTRTDDEVVAIKRDDARRKIYKRFGEYYYDACGGHPSPDDDFSDLDIVYRGYATQEQIDYEPDWPFPSDPRDG